LLLHALLLAVVLAATLAGYNTSDPLVITAEGEPQRVFHNFHEVENDGAFIFRWSSGASSICIDQYGHAPRTLVSVRLLAGGAVPLGVDEAGFQVNGTHLLTTTLRPQIRDYQVLLSGAQQHGGDLCFTIASPTAQPPGDFRQLGIPFREMTIARATAAGLVLPPLLQTAQNLALALLCFWLLRMLGLVGWLAVLLVAAPAAAISGAIVGGVITPGLNVTRTLQPLIGSAAVLAGGALLVRPLARRLIPRLPINRRLATDLLLMLYWSVVLWSGVRFLQMLSGHHGVWPLKAGVWPNFTPMVLVALIAFAAWLTLLIRRLQRHADHAEPRAGQPWRTALLLLLAGAVLLPVALKVSVRGWELLFYTFRDNPTDYIHDVPRIENPITFLRHYVELSPTLAWHNANHPPGSVLLLWLVAQVLGPGPSIATWVAIALSSLSTVAAFWLGMRMGGLPIALLAGAIAVAMPGHQVYSVTSMDGVFNAIIALGMVAFFLALEPQAKPRQAVLAGGLIALGLFFTYATTQLAFFGAALVLAAVLRPGGRVAALRQASIAAGTLLLIYVLLFVATGFNVVEAAVQATENNARYETSRDLFVTRAIDHYVRFLAINIVPFGWYLAPWGLTALTPFVLGMVRQRRWLAPQHTLDARLATLTFGLVALVAGMWLGGLFIREVERIWAFVYPLAAVLIAHHAWQGETQWERLWRAGLYVTLFFAQSAVMRMLLNTYW
jgi:hypothetical protein